MGILKNIRCNITGGHDYIYKYTICIGEHKMSEYVCCKCGHIVIENNCFRVELPEFKIKIEGQEPT